VIAEDADVTLRFLRPTDNASVIQQCVVELGVWALGASELVEVEPHLPTTRVGSTAEPPYQPSCGGIKEYCTASEAEADYCLSNVVPDARQGAKRELIFRNRSAEPRFEFTCDTDEDRRPSAQS
jgi:hypothetical protein